MEANIIFYRYKENPNLLMRIYNVLGNLNISYEVSEHYITIPKSELLKLWIKDCDTPIRYEVRKVISESIKDDEYNEIDLALIQTSFLQSTEDSIVTPRIKITLTENELLFEVHLLKLGETKEFRIMIDHFINSENPKIFLTTGINMFYSDYIGIWQMNRDLYPLSLKLTVELLILKYCKNEND